MNVFREKKHNERLGQDRGQSTLNLVSHVTRCLSHLGRLGELPIVHGDAGLLAQGRLAQEHHAHVGPGALSSIGGAHVLPAGGGTIVSHKVVAGQGATALEWIIVDDLLPPVPPVRK